MHSRAAIDHSLRFQQLASVKHGVAGMTRRAQIQSILSLIIMVAGCLNGGCVQYSHNLPLSAAGSQSETVNQHSQRININTASAEELEKLPGIGKGLAARIVEHRDKYGPFRKPEHLIIVRGISDKRFRTLQDFIAVE